MSWEALRWAITGDHKVPPHLRMTLTVLAFHAHGADGSDMREYQHAIAAEVGLSDRQIRTHLLELEALGLITRGDQTTVETLPARKRPVVWDVILTGTVVPVMTGSGLPRNSVLTGSGLPTPKRNTQREVLPRRGRSNSVTHLRSVNSADEEWQ